MIVLYITLSPCHLFIQFLATAQLVTLPHLSILHTWKWVEMQKHFVLCIIPLIVPRVSFLSKERGKACLVSVVLHSQMKTFHVAFLLFIFQVGQTKFILVSAIQCVCIQSSAIHKDRKCCQKMTNCPEYAITLSISCPVIVFLNCGGNGHQQFNCYGLFLIRLRQLVGLFLVYISCFRNRSML